MANPPVIRIDAVTPGMTVRVVLVNTALSQLFNYQPTIKGIWRRNKGSDELAPLRENALRRVIGFNRRSFLAKVIANDTVEETLTIEVEDTQPLARHLWYRMEVPYTTFSKLSRLVQDADNDITEEEEEKRRRQRNRIGNDFFHPHARFVPISLII